MKKILFFVLSAVFCIPNADAAVRDANTVTRGKTSTITTSKQPVRSITNRSAVKKTIAARTPSSVSVLSTRNAVSSGATRTSVTNRPNTQARVATVKKQNVSARAATQTTVSISETKTGLAYEQCKTAFFTCMDQFCELKNDAFKRCSCNDRVFNFQEITDTYQQVSEQLTEFNENLDTVGLTKEQAIAMKTATEGEDALAEDKSSSKQLLQAIMNAIKGEDSTVGGKYKDLNSITISSDISFAFGMDDYGQIIASYNGLNLYKAVYPKCRNAVREDCTDAYLQRAVNAYLMAIEQDCNTVETALASKSKELKASTYESSAMLDLARVENRQKHNSDDIATCLTNIEAAIQNEDVCGTGYHKCLDNGQYIDVKTGAPLTGVKDFYKLETLLTFKDNQDLHKQKLSTLSDNRDFVKFFENKTKKFAEQALDKCAEQSDKVWSEYLDRALLDIYYAQKAKVKTIKQSCFNLVAACYENQSTAITDAMENLTGNYANSMQPATITLTQQMCSDYIESCNNMFSDSVVKEYMANKNKYDTELACRAIAQQCFDSFGGTNYANFYTLQNGLIERGKAIDWFALYDCTNISDGDECLKTKFVSPCAEELANTASCNTPEVLEQVFGGLDKYDDGYRYEDTVNNISDVNRNLRPTGIASEVYSQIIDRLSTQCDQVHGFFVQAQYAVLFGYQANNFCLINQDPGTYFWRGYYNLNPENHLDYWYHFKDNENMCPAGYYDTIDTQSWGMCSCWENGNYRSKNGTENTCRPIVPMLNTYIGAEEEPICTNTWLSGGSDTANYTKNKWCQQNVKSSLGQVCPKNDTITAGSNIQCADNSADNISRIEVIYHQDLHNQPNTNP